MVAFRVRAGICALDKPARSGWRCAPPLPPVASPAPKTYDASLSGEISPAVERAHLDEVRERRAAVRSGQARLVDGTEALRKARAGVRE